MADARAMSDATQEETPEAYVQRFWATHASAFMRWFLALPYTGQVSLLRNASPDIAVSYDPHDRHPQPTQLLAPELSLKGLLDDNGKSLLRLMNARARRPDDCTRHDLVYLRSLRSDDSMPTFSGDTFKDVPLAFIDPADPEQNVQQVASTASEETLAEKKKQVQDGQLIEADVWLALQMRQRTITTLLANVANTFESMFLHQTMMNAVASQQVGCRYCGVAKQEDGSNLLQCACGGAFYCSKEHQKEDWSSHKKSCQAIQNAKANDTSASE